MKNILSKNSYKSKNAATGPQKGKKRRNKQLMDEIKKLYRTFQSEEEM
jgi:hypothetical protein